mmetsp:Transcript_123089/g.359379  ORF Transcript_123089/g.359379 Transcript_123089/m.359379 type:complete len:222 (+) Transcript_123089:83-748(+)
MRSQMRPERYYTGSKPGKPPLADMARAHCVPELGWSGRHGVNHSGLAWKRLGWWLPKPSSAECPTSQPRRGSRRRRAPPRSAAPRRRRCGLVVSGSPGCAASGNLTTPLAERPPASPGQNHGGPSETAPAAWTLACPLLPSSGCRPPRPPETSTTPTTLVDSGCTSYPRHPGVRGTARVGASCRARSHPAKSVLLQAHRQPALLPLWGAACSPPRCRRRPR